MAAATNQERFLSSALVSSRRLFEPNPKSRSSTDTTNIRRHKEAQAIHEMAKYLPLENIALSTRSNVNQPSILRLAVQYLKVKEILASTLKGGDPIGFDFGDNFMFGGFVIVMSLDGTIMYASSNIQEQLGTSLIDIIGVPFIDLLDPNESSEIKQKGMKTLGDVFEHYPPQFPTVLRMKTNMSPTVRSQAKIQYKRVYIRSHIKKYRETNKGEDELAAHMAILLCRTEDLIGFPEIVIGAHFTIFTDLNHCLYDCEWKAHWLVGYEMDQVKGISTDVLKHPNDQKKITEYKRRLEIAYKEGSLLIPPHRIQTGWGQWLWIRSTGYPIIEKRKFAGIRYEVQIIGVADEHDVLEGQSQSTIQLKPEPEDLSALEREIFNEVSSDRLSHVNLEPQVQPPLMVSHPLAPFSSELDHSPLSNISSPPQSWGPAEPYQNYLGDFVADVKPIVFEDACLQPQPYKGMKYEAVDCVPLNAPPQLSRVLYADDYNTHTFIQSHSSCSSLASTGSPKSVEMIGHLNTDWPEQSQCFSTTHPPYYNAFPM